MMSGFTLSVTVFKFDVLMLTQYFLLTPPLESPLLKRQLFMYAAIECFLRFGYLFG